MIKVPIEVIIMEEENTEVVAKAIRILNSLQNTFRYSIIKIPEELNATLKEKFSETDSGSNSQQMIYTKAIYSFGDDLLKNLKGYHPHIVFLTKYYLHSDNLYNLFANMQYL